VNTSGNDPNEDAGEHVRIVEPAETVIDEPSSATADDDNSQVAPAASAPTGSTGAALRGLGFGLQDRDWTDERWRGLLDRVIDQGLFTWREVVWLALGHVNPSQVGTSLASSEGFKRNYGKGNTMAVVMEWFYEQNGRCAEAGCGTRLELQADHVKPREDFKKEGKAKHEADTKENMVLRCRRHNVIKRPSHALGGTTFLTLEAALMWILLEIQPRTRVDYGRLCRIYGMSMSDIRIDEAWAMAGWLAAERCYQIEDNERGTYRLLKWPDGAITRVRAREAAPVGCDVIRERVPGTSFVGFITLGDPDATDYTFRQMSVAEIPFSTYDLGNRPANDLAIQYVAPKKGQRATSQRLFPLAPRDHHLVDWALRAESELFVIEAATAARGFDRGFEAGESKRRKLRDGAKIAKDSVRLDVV